MWDRVLAVNLKSMFLTAKFAVPRMRERGGGSVVNVASVQGLAAQTNVVACTVDGGLIAGLPGALQD